MGLFGKKSSKTPELFTLPPDIRPDIRQVFDSAPPDACNGLLREERNLVVILELDDRLPNDETVSALTRCVSVIGEGYMVLTDRRLIFALEPRSGDGPTEMIAIPLGEISQFVFDSGVAGVAYEGNQLTVGLVQGGPYSQKVCTQVKSVVERNKPYRL